MKPKKILIIRNDHIGDMILTTGIFRELKKEFPNSELTVIVSKANRSMIENNLNVDEILVADHGKKLLKNWKGYPKLWKKIKNKNFDIGIDLRGDFLNIFFLMFLTRVRKRIGLHKGRLSKLFLDYGRIRDIKKHEIQNMFDVVNEGLGINLKNLKPEIFVSNSDRKDLSELIKKNKPTKVFTHSIEDPHPDHRAVHKITKEIYAQISGKKPELYVYSIWNPVSIKTSWPKMYVDITKSFSKKLKALKEYPSQRFQAIYPLMVFVFWRAFKNGLKIRKRMAETFYRVK